MTGACRASARWLKNAYVTEHTKEGAAYADRGHRVRGPEELRGYHDRALSEPVRVTKYGRETVYIISADTFHAMRQAVRAALGTKDLTDEETALIEASEIPTGHLYSAED
ncbi:hypothetical protein [Plastoroseomonas hellenica]|uniref:hypothetical protein n=1 Tax=Plastoroseomonas hellenica TaxID=2687306 RepID=UPI001FEC3C1F|nr:hypothetical protein [Plastoroseomonas hellenica]